MADVQTFPAQLEVVLIPDDYTEAEKLLGASWPLGAGHVEVRANFGGTFLRLWRGKAGGVLDDLARAKQQQSEQQAQQQAASDQSQQQTTTPPEQSQPQTTG